MAEIKKIYLFCEAGMSTSIMVKKLEQVAKDHNMPLEIKAFPIAHAVEQVEKDRPILVLLGPQVKFLESKMHKQLDKYNIPISVIDTAMYGSMDGEGVMKAALRTLKMSKQK